MKAVAFVIVNDLINDSCYNGKKPVLTWEKIDEMRENIEFGSHTMSHDKKLTKRNDERVKRELEESKRIIDEKMYFYIKSASCDSIAWPYGRSNSKMTKMAIDARYSYFFTCNEYDVIKPWAGIKQ